MHRRMTSFLVYVLLISGMFVPGVAPVVATQNASDAKILRINGGDFFPDPTFDPQLSDNGQGFYLFDFEGLTRIDEDLQVVPGAAESWEFSSDGNTLTFRLREGLVFSDGVPITAEHFRFGIERMCSPELDSRIAIQLFDIVGCEELFNSGDAANTAQSDASPAPATGSVTLGVHALDDRTLEIEFERPAPYFPSLASNWVAFPMRQDVIEAGGPEWWSNPATRIGNGPFRLVAYEADKPNQRLTFARNDHYWGGRTKLDGIDFLFLDYGDPANMTGYEQGEFDITWPPEAMFPVIEADPILSRELISLPIPGTIYWDFNHKREPFTDKKVREAFAYGFDREGYCRQIVLGACTPTLSWIAPGAPGAIETDAFAFDPGKAREALAASSYGSPENLPEIVWYVFEGSPIEERFGEWLAAQYRQVLGIDLTLVSLPEEEYDALYADHDDWATWPQFHEATWWASADPSTWFAVWRCGSELNQGYCNPELEALLDRAGAELDPEARIALYEEAGHLLVADVPAVFVHTASNSALVKPYVTGYSRITPDGNWPAMTNLLSVDVERPG
jgi:oligopeptide transport system substrate-binding protein